MHEVVLDVNGVARSVSVAATDTLLKVLRDELRLTGAKRGCDYGVCGVCSVLIEGKPARSCLALAADCENRAITTVEGLAPDGKLLPLQQAMLEAGAVQCGFCTPAIVLAASALLAANPRPSEAEIRVGLSGNICRCTGYMAIIEAIMRVANEPV